MVAKKLKETQQYSLTQLMSACVSELTLLLEGGLFLFLGLSFIADVSNGVVLGTGKSAR